VLTEAPLHSTGRLSDCVLLAIRIHAYAQAAMRSPSNCAASRRNEGRNAQNPAAREATLSGFEPFIRGDSGFEIAIVLEANGRALILDEIDLGLPSRVHAGPQGFQRGSPKCAPLFGESRLHDLTCKDPQPRAESHLAQAEEYLQQQTVTGKQCHCTNKLYSKPRRSYK
jgi:hypothetical protein